MIMQPRASFFGISKECWYQSTTFLFIQERFLQVFLANLDSGGQSLTGFGPRVKEREEEKC